MCESPLTCVQDLCEFLEAFAPARLAEEWDNVGLLVGSSGRPASRVMTCLTVTPASAAEAIREEADAIVAHHPLPFRPLKRLTDETVPGKILLDLIRHEIAVYSPHTAFDSASAGINQRLAVGLGLSDIRPLVVADSDPDGLGSGRWGRFTSSITMQELVNRVKGFLGVTGLHVVGRADLVVDVAAVACGSAGAFLEPARRVGCQALVTGETSFHTCLEAEARDIALILPGHFASERFAVEKLAEVISQHFPKITVWPCRAEADPLRWM